MVIGSMGAAVRQETQAKTNPARARVKAVLMGVCGLGESDGLANADE
jgi:hypothetical protein